MIIKSFLRKKDTKIYFVIITIIILVISILLSFIKYYQKIVDDIYDHQYGCCSVQKLKAVYQCQLRSGYRKGLRIKKQNVSKTDHRSGNRIRHNGKKIHPPPQLREYLQLLDGISHGKGNRRSEQRRQNGNL